jgi:hypothetical protein
MTDWAVPVGGRFSDATVAACAVEAVRRVAARPEMSSAVVADTAT